MQIRLAVAVVLVCCTGGAGAADWSFDPKITLNAVYDDNNRLTEIRGEEVEVTGGELDAQLTMRAETPRSTFRLIPRLRATMYPDEEDDETTDQFLRLGWAYRGERSEASFDAHYSNRTILGDFFPDSAVPDDGELGEPGRGEGIGQSTGENEEERIEASTGVAFELTERTILDLKVGGLDVSFDEQVVDDREDYTDVYGSMGLGFRMSPSAKLSVVARASRYEPDSGLNSDANTLNVEWSNRISETSQVFVRGGAYRVKSDATVDSDWENGFNGGAGVRWSFEVTQIFVDLNHYLDPSSYGRVVQRDQLRLQLLRQLSPLTTIRLAARGIRDEDAGTDDAFQEREYATASVDFDWRVSRQFTLGAGYQYSWREEEDEPNSAESNSLYIGITYEPNRR